MPALVCTAKTCIYNKNELCSKGDIKVEGNTARTKDETCCSSFQERTGQSMSNSCADGSGCTNISVSCSACECKYNEEMQCHAGSIDIKGSQACCCEDTCCSTFDCH